MDIGKTVRCYTVEPIRDPIRHRQAERESPPWSPAKSPLEYLDTWGHHSLPHPEASFVSVVTPAFLRALGE